MSQVYNKEEKVSLKRESGCRHPEGNKGLGTPEEKRPERIASLVADYFLCTGSDVCHLDSIGGSYILATYFCGIFIVVVQHCFSGFFFKSSDS